MKSTATFSLGSPNSKLSLLLLECLLDLNGYLSVFCILVQLMVSNLCIFSFHRYVAFVTIPIFK